MAHDRQPRPETGVLWGGEKHIITLIVNRFYTFADIWRYAIGNAGADGDRVRLLGYRVVTTVVRNGTDPLSSGNALSLP